MRRTEQLVKAITNVLEGEAGMLDSCRSLSGVAIFVNYDKSGAVRRVSLRPELDYEREPSASRRPNPPDPASVAGS